MARGKAKGSRASAPPLIPSLGTTAPEWQICQRNRGAWKPIPAGPAIRVSGGGARWAKLELVEPMGFDTLIRTARANQPVQVRTDGHDRVAITYRASVYDSRTKERFRPGLLPFLQGKT